MPRRPKKAAARATAPFDWDRIATYAATPFPDNWPADEWLLCSPRDPGVHAALLDGLRSCGHSLLANHYGFTDPEVAAEVAAILRDPHVAAVINLDASQAAGPQESKLLRDVGIEAYEGTSVAVGYSVHHRISHMKVTVIDGWLTFSGSTNLSLSGEGMQDNALTISRNPLIAARYSAVILNNHACMLGQMKARAGRASSARGS